MRIANDQTHKFMCPSGRNEAKSMYFLHFEKEKKMYHELKSTWEMPSTRFKYESNSFGVEQEIENSFNFEVSLIECYIHVNDSTE